MNFAWVVAAFAFLSGAGALEDVPLSYDLPASWAEGRVHQIGSGDDYRKLHQRSVDEPAAFWAQVADQFEWRGAPLDASSGLQFNFNRSNGPIYSQWFKGSATNLA